MNRLIIIRTLAESIKRLKLSQRTLCTEAVAKVSSSNGAQPSNDHVERPNFSNKRDPYDIAIVGGGMVGMALACSLDVGARKYVDQNRHAYFDQMQVWAYTGLGYTRYDARDVHKDSLGCVVENKVLHSSLLSCMQNTDFQKTVYPSRLSTMTLQPRNLSMGMESTSSGLNEQGNLVKLDLIDGNSLYAKLVVGADGSKSRVRELAGFKTTGWNYSQNC